MYSNERLNKMRDDYIKVHAWILKFPYEKEFEAVDKFRIDARGPFDMYAGAGELDVHAITHAIEDCQECDPKIGPKYREIMKYERPFELVNPVENLARAQEKDFATYMDEPNLKGDILLLAHNMDLEFHDIRWKFDNEMGGRVMMELRTERGVQPTEEQMKLVTGIVNAIQATDFEQYLIDNEFVKDFKGGILKDTEEPFHKTSSNLSLTDADLSFAEEVKDAIKSSMSM